jgi:predicted AAA+ superfamily ATPase
MAGTEKNTRKELIERAYNQLMGENLRKDSHYITVWAPRQTGKSWVMQEVLLRLKNNPQFDTIKISLQSLKNIEEGEKRGYTNYRISPVVFKDFFRLSFKS